MAQAQTATGDTGNDELQFEDKEGVQLAEWLEGVLKTYCLNLAKRRISSPDEALSMSDKVGKESKSQVAISAAGEAQIKKNIYLFITKIKFDKYQNETDTSVSDLLNVEIGYYAGDRKVKRRESFVICISRSLDNNVSSIEKVLETDKREIDFYTKLIPELEDWAATFGVTVKFALPICFFGEYEVDNPSKFKFMFEEPENEYEPNEKPETTLLDMLRPRKVETRAILILHNLEKIHFKMRDETNLQVQEVKAVLRELAEIHAVSWVYQYLTNTPLSEKWPFLLRPRETVPVCVSLIKHGISALLNSFRKKFPNNETVMGLSHRLYAVQPKLTAILNVLLTPPAPSTAPSCILHFDLHACNIFFRKVDGKHLPRNHNLKSDEIESRLTQWKLASVGTPMRDVAFLLLTSLSPQDRRNCATDLIKFYYKCFQKTAKQFGLHLPFKSNFFLAEYDKSLFLSLLLIIGNFEEEMLDVPVSDSILQSFLAGLEDVAAAGSI